LYNQRKGKKEEKAMARISYHVEYKTKLVLEVIHGERELVQHCVNLGEELTLSIDASMMQNIETKNKGCMSNEPENSS